MTNRCWSIGLLVNWSVDRFVGLSVEGWSIGKLVGWSVGRLVCGFVGWPVGLWVGGFAGWCGFVFFFSTRLSTTAEPARNTTKC